MVIPPVADQAAAVSGGAPASSAADAATVVIVAAVVVVATAAVLNAAFFACLCTCSAAPLPGTGHLAGEMKLPLRILSSPPQSIFQGHWGAFFGASTEGYSGVG